jgi:predicted RNA-binding Zn-ribbon protein involved in translation (DUF1610 family)
VSAEEHQTGRVTNFFMETVAQSVPGYHSHACPVCGLLFIHADDKGGQEIEHTCPGCGKVLPLTGWPSGWAKATVLTPQGQHIPFAKPVGSPAFGKVVLWTGLVLLIGGITGLWVVGWEWIGEHLKNVPLAVKK